LVTIDYFTITAHGVKNLKRIIRLSRSRRLKWAGHVARMGDNRGTYKVLVGKPDGRRPLRRSRFRWEDNIKRDHREVEWGGAWTGSVVLRISTGGGHL
jgi:hypothetical protein